MIFLATMRRCQGSDTKGIRVDSMHNGKVSDPYNVVKFDANDQPGSPDDDSAG